MIYIADSEIFITHNSSRANLPYDDYTKITTLADYSRLILLEAYMNAYARMLGIKVATDGTLKFYKFLNIVYIISDNTFCYSCQLRD